MPTQVIDWNQNMAKVEGSALVVIGSVATTAATVTSPEVTAINSAGAGSAAQVGGRNPVGSLAPFQTTAGSELITTGSQYILGTPVITGSVNVSNQTAVWVGVGSVNVINTLSTSDPSVGAVGTTAPGSVSEIGARTSTGSMAPLTVGAGSELITTGSQYVLGTATVAGSVAVTNTPSFGSLLSQLPAGTNNIGDVDVLTLPGVLGSVAVTNQVSVLGSTFITNSITVSESDNGAVSSAAPGSAAQIGARLPNGSLAPLRVDAGSELVTTGSHYILGTATVLGSVSVTGGNVGSLLSQLPAGTNNIGDVDVLTLPGQLGSALVTQGTNPWIVLGSVFQTNESTTVTNPAIGAIASAAPASGNHIAVRDSLGSLTPLIAVGSALMTLGSQAGVWTVNTVGSLLSQLPAGTNNIGDVDVLTLPGQLGSALVTQGTSPWVVLGSQYALGTTTILGSVSVTGGNVGSLLSQLPAGTNNIGDVDVLTLPGALGSVAISTTQFNVGSLNRVTQATFDHGAAVNFGSITAVQIVATSIPVQRGVLVRSSATNAATVYVGNSDVTPGTGSPTDGYELSPGESVELEVDNANKVYVIAGSLTNNRASWLVI